MINAKLKITGLASIEAALPKATKEVKEIARELAVETAELQEQLILAGTDPTGAPQKSIKESTESRKRSEDVSHNVPLYRTGRLAEASGWKIGKTKRGAMLRPPKDRQVAAYVLMAKGYRLVFNSPLPEEITASAEAKLQKLADKL